MTTPRRNFLKELGWLTLGMAGFSVFPMAKLLPAQSSFRRIDVFPHIWPKKFFDRYRRKTVGCNLDRLNKAFPTLSDLDRRFRTMDQFENYFQVLTLASPPVEECLGPQDSAELAQLANDEMTELVSRYPQRFVGAVACLPMNNLKAASLELERAIEQLGMKGVQLYTNINGQPLDRPEYLEIFDQMARYDLPVWMHPWRVNALPDHLYPDYPRGKESLYEFTLKMGWPYDTTLFMFRLVFTGIFDRNPDLKVIIHHLGAMIPYFRGRIENFVPGPALQRLKQQPYEYFRMFYADTAVQGGASQGIASVMEAGIDFFGPDHVLFGTDMPFDLEGGKHFTEETIVALEAARFSADEKRKMFEGNAVRLLGL